MARGVWEQVRWGDSFGGVAWLEETVPEFGSDGVFRAVQINEGTGNYAEDNIIVDWKKRSPATLYQRLGNIV